MIYIYDIYIYMIYIWYIYIYDIYIYIKWYVCMYVCMYVCIYYILLYYIILYYIIIYYIILYYVILYFIILYYIIEWHDNIWCTHVYLDITQPNYNILQPHIYMLYLVCCIVAGSHSSTSKMGWDRKFQQDSKLSAEDSFFRWNDQLLIFQRKGEGRENLTRWAPQNQEMNLGFWV